MPPALPLRVVTQSTARQFGLAAILAVMAIEVSAAVSCGGPIPIEGLLTRLTWLLIPLAPALLAVLTPNPLCSVAAAIPVALWIAYAYYVDCLRPYQGGGASMSYIAVWFYGFLSSAAAAVLAIPVLRLLNVRIGAAR